MSVAQDLYEGGWITYMRTDSVTLSDTAIAAARAQVLSLFGPSYLPAKPRVYASKVKNAQEAPEHVRDDPPHDHQPRLRVQEGLCPRTDLACLRRDPAARGALRTPRRLRVHGRHGADARRDRQRRGRAQGGAERLLLRYGRGRGRGAARGRHRAG